MFFFHALDPAPPARCNACVSTKTHEPSKRLALAHAAADAIDARRRDIQALRLIAGFDGAVDSIIRVVDTRASRDDYSPMRSMAQFAERIQTHVGRNINIEFVAEQVKIGGNGPLFANPFTKWGAKTWYIGALLLDDDSLESRTTHPVFDEFIQRCEKVYPVAAPALSDACEFSDGKVIIGKTAAQDMVSWERVLDAVGGADALVRMFTDASLFAPMNWTMLTGMTDLWRRIAREVMPRVPADKRPAVFIDLADPTKRSEADLREALDALRELNQHARLTLGCNFNESSRIARVLGAPLPENDADLAPRAGALRDIMGIHAVCVHTRHRAAAANEHGSAQFDAAFTKDPAISTGAGDNFNAGYALGAALDLELPHRLALGAANSGFYVRNRTPTTLDQLVRFLREMPEPEFH